MWKCLSRPASGGLSAAHAFVPFTRGQGRKKGTAPSRAGRRVSDLQFWIAARRPASRVSNRVTGNLARALRCDDWIAMEILGTLWIAIGGYIASSADSCYTGALSLDRSLPPT